MHHLRPLTNCPTLTKQSARAEENPSLISGLDLIASTIHQNRARMERLALPAMPIKMPSPLRLPLVHPPDSLSA